MQRMVPLSLIICVTALLAFGAFAMHMQAGAESESATSCIAVAAKGLPCPENAGPIGFLAFHLSALKDLVVAGVGAFAAATFALLLAAAFAAMNFTACPVVPDGISAARPLRREPRAFTPFLLRELAYWIALHEQSPSDFTGRSA